MNKMRWRWGDTNPVLTPPIDSAQVIEIGDLVFLSQTYSNPSAGVNVGEVASADDFPWTTDLQTTQQMFKKDFLGIAMQQSRAGDIEPIRVATGGVFEFDCASASFALGALLAVAKQAGNFLENQKVVLATNVNGAMARCWKKTASLTTVLAEISTTSLAKVGTNVSL